MNSRRSGAIEGGTGGAPLRVVAVLDATRGDGPRQRRALAAFLRDGLAGAPPGETLLFHHVGRGRERLAALAPTPDVRLVAVPPRAPAAMAAALATAVAASAPEERVVVLFAAGPAGTELAARLARRSGGSALSGVLAAETAGSELVCRRAVYSGHLAARFALRAAPWCLVLDASWDDASEQDTAQAVTVTSAAGARVLGDERAPAAALDGALENVRLEAAPAGDELSAARLLVVAGRGAGGRDGVARIAAAAARLGAAFAVSRPVAMNAWAPMDRLVGVSGARVSPALCIVAGVSGAPAFVWGIERAGFIVAVTTDDAAPIRHEADVVVLGDAVSTVEELARAVAAEGRGTRA